ncbi:MAG: glycosyltransferase family 4 protein [Deltaproteobacteria bacterium]|nr:glycosyltransferase family 4 protein [Deltaproteobacteria bacterium]
MKIALLRQRVGGPGGAETTLQHLARGLAAAGQVVTVYGSQAADAARQVLGPGIAYVPVPVWGGKTARLLTFALNTRRLLRLAGPCVVFSLERTLSPQVYRAGDGCHRQWLRLRTPYLSPAARVVQGLSLFHRVLLALERRLFSDPHLHRVIANSRQVKAEIIRHYQVDPARLVVIYNGLDRQKFRPLAEPERTALKARLGAAAVPIILFAGSGFRRKGLTYLLDAFSSIKNQESVLWVVGQGRLAPYQRQARRLGLEGRIKFWGPQADLAPFYQAATVLALPTIYDPCSNVVLEALSCGVPVITTAANGAAEFLAPGTNGAILARPDDLSGLTHALDEYLARGEAPEVRRAAVAAVAHLSWEATVAQTLKVLEEAAAVGAGSPRP